MGQADKHTDILHAEEEVRERVDDSGQRWKKVYFGGGAHFDNWFSQCIEIYGKDNVDVEEIDSQGFICYSESGEKMRRIWIREDTPPEQGNLTDKR